MKKKIISLLFIASSLILLSCGEKKSSSKCDGNGVCPIGKRLSDSSLKQ